MTRFEPSPRKADPKQMISGQAMLKALREVGIIPDDMYTTGGVTIRIERGYVVDPGIERQSAVVVADISIIVPADKLRRALDICDVEDGRVPKATVA